MLTAQEIKYDGDKVYLRNTFDISTAKALASDANKSGGAGTKNFRLTGFIPPEMWNYDPWLRASLEAKRMGDPILASRNMKKFFKAHPYLAVDYQKRVWNMG